MSDSRKGPGCLLGGLAFVMAAVFVGSALAAFLLFDIEGTLVQPGPYKEAMAQQDAYAKVPSLVAEWLSNRPAAGAGSGDAAAKTSDQAFIAQIESLDATALKSCLESGLAVAADGTVEAASRPPTAAELDQVKRCLRASGAPSGLAATHGDMPVFFWMLSEKDWQGLFATMLPPGWLRGQTESVIDQAYGHLAADQAGRPIYVSMTALKARLLGDEGFDAVVQLINAQPACFDVQLATIQGLNAQTAPLQALPFCRPPASTMSTIGPNIRKALADLAGQIPNQVDLTHVGASGASSGDPFESPRQILSAIRTASLLALLLSIISLALLALCLARSVKGLLRCLGVPLLVTGLIGVAIAASGISATHQAVSEALIRGSADNSSITPGVRELLAGILGTITQGYFSALWMQFVVLAVVGLAMVLASFLVGRSRQTSSASTAANSTP